MKSEFYAKKTGSNSTKSGTEQKVRNLKKRS